MKKGIYLAALLMSVAIASAHAGTCEQDFKTVGDPRNGLTYRGTVKVLGLSVSSALGQLQKLAMDEGFQVGGETISGDAGELTFMQANVKPPLTVKALASGSGEVSITTKPAPGQKFPVEAARANICGMLTKLKSGKEGEAIAAAARAKSGTGRIIDAKAVELSAEIGREVRKTTSTLNTRGLKDLLLGTYTSSGGSEIDATLAPLAAKYVGRTYRIDGQVYTASESFERDTVGRIDYLVTVTRGLLRVRQDSSYNNLNFSIECKMALDQQEYFSTLRSQDWVTLIGKVEEFTPQGMVLKDCRQAN